MDISVHDLLIALDMSLIIHFPRLILTVDKLTLQARWGTKISSWEHIIIMVHIAPKSIVGKKNLLVYVISRSQKWSQNVSKFAVAERNLGFLLGPEDNRGLFIETWGFETY